MESIFKTGDRVHYIGEESDLTNGRVVDIVIDGVEPWIGVEWDNWYDGHDCGGKARESQGYYVYESTLEHEYIRDDSEFHSASVSDLFETL